ncbi:HotDog domain-containing protein [Xylaria bambusicola]|uniref:HotDog domain-containing protein n=1 Tax=Xylaria bambusicola TaxID=326684 RepID=UPI002007458C|nr:HotDog domain-containing protein [Xylaria bambusicola]KAI0508972.1 HotDog domain-containing protein [Xylaria bambusicola]
MLISVGAGLIRCLFSLTDSLQYALQQRCLEDILEMDTPDHAHFAAIPWCARHLQGERVVVYVPTNRTRKPSGEDNLFADTLNSKQSISHTLQIHEKPLSPTGRIDETKTFLALGSGLNGYPDVCHGGLTMAILDELMGQIMPLNQQRGAIPRGMYMTAYLNARFLKPVSTPAVILARAWIAKVKGRKFFLEATVEDEQGVILARAESLFVQLKSSL